MLSLGDFCRDMDIDPVPLKWIPEDDLLLKNAVESGASLEALAKGAVEFSRRFTLQELQERWYSLLFDDDISSQASYRMFELEISGVSTASKYRPPQETSSVKNKKARKFESIRRKYYVTRKKLRTEFSGDIDLEFFESGHRVVSGHMADLQVMPGRDRVHIEVFEEEELAFLRANLLDDESLGDGTGDASQNENPDLFEQSHQKRIMDSSGFNELPACASSVEAGDEFCCSAAQLQNWTEMQNVISPALHAAIGFPETPDAVVSVKKETNEAINTGEITDPDSLLNLPIEVEPLLANFDVKPAALDKCCALDVDAISRDSVIDGLELTTDAWWQDNPVSEATLAVNRKFPLIGDIVYARSLSNLPSKTDFSDGNVICLLNTEDSEIPCNDDIFLLIHPIPEYFPSETIIDTTISSYAPSSPVKREHEPAVNLLAAETARSSVLHHTTPKVLDNFMKKEAHGIDTKVPGLPPVATDTVLSAAVPPKKMHLQFFDDSLVSDDENPPMDYDVPYFSDVEAMILEMDLDPCEDDSHMNKTVPSYQHDETKRTIIRLEQGARAYLQRAMTSQGAFAIFYGRHLKHYIKKTEVLIGRSTDDIIVDIDLAIEGRANKISRRQAIIKMEANGSFFMKNLGRSSILLNGGTVLNGQVVSLCSGCLIEIKGLSFIFEINHGYVKKHLGKLHLHNGKVERADRLVEQK